MSDKKETTTAGDYTHQLRKVGDALANALEFCWGHYACGGRSETRSLIDAWKVLCARVTAAESRAAPSVPYQSPRERLKTDEERAEYDKHFAKHYAGEVARTATQDTHQERKLACDVVKCFVTQVAECKCCHEIVAEMQNGSRHIIAQIFDRDLWAEYTTPKAVWSARPVCNVDAVKQVFADWAQGICELLNMGDIDKHELDTRLYAHASLEKRVLAALSQHGDKKDG